MIKFFIFILLLFVYSFSYSYNFNNNTFNYYIWEYIYEKSYIIDNVKFIAQAPLQTKENWFKNYESCEEAALIMSHFTINDIYYDEFIADKEIDKLNDYQEFTLWIERNKVHNVDSNKLYIRDITIKEIQNVAKLYYWYTESNSHIINSPSLETIKYLLSNDYIVIIPSYTKTLANPNFNLLTNSYHVINLVWYDENQFITHDPGTSKGAFYKYDYSIILEWIKQNWDDILILEWKINKDNIDFKDINDEIIVSRKVNLIFNKINRLLDKQTNNQEEFLTKILDNLRKNNQNNFDDKNSKLFSALDIKIRNRLEMIIDRRKNLAYLSEKLKKHFDK